jgi:hypothetical protein
MKLDYYTLRQFTQVYWNSGAHNYNDFNSEAFLGVLRQKQIQYCTEQCILKCLEIGVNIIPPIPTNQFLDYCFLHKTKPLNIKKKMKI